MTVDRGSVARGVRAPGNGCESISPDSLNQDNLVVTDADILAVRGLIRELTALADISQVNGRRGLAVPLHRGARALRAYAAELALLTGAMTQWLALNLAGSGIAAAHYFNHGQVGRLRQCAAYSLDVERMATCLDFSKRLFDALATVEG